MRRATKNTGRSTTRRSIPLAWSTAAAGLFWAIVLAGCSDLQDRPTATVAVLTDPVQTACGTCHGLPPGPETGHPQSEKCQVCHGAVVGDSLRITTPALHRDGQVQVFSHPEGWLDPAAKESFHGESIRNSGWDMAGCRACHGSDYAGGLTGSSCLTCHPRTPEGCTVCHGSAAGSAPPEDTHGNTDTQFAGVGAHQAHVQGGTVGRALACGECHRTPTSFADPNHLDGDGRAEVVFGDLSRTGGVVPEYDPVTAACSDSYCHDGGRFGQGGSVGWTTVGTGAGACGTCHGIPPSTVTGHPAVPSGVSCAVCHATVVDERLAIVSTDLHLNGRADATCGTCHGLPPAPETGHPPMIKNVPWCACHGSVVDAQYRFVDEGLHRNGSVDF